MKRVLFTSIIGIVVVFFSLGFQCSSPELTSTRLYVNQKNWDLALKSAEKEVTNNPKSVEGWYYVGVLKGEKDNYAGMIEAFQKVRSLDPIAYKKEIDERMKYYWANSFNKGVNHFNKGKDKNSNEAYDNAIKAFKECILIQPDSAAPYWNLAATYASKGDPEGAVEAYTFLAEKKNDLSAHIRLGDAFVEKGNSHKTKFDTDNKEKISTKFNLESVEKKLSKETIRKTLGEPDKINKPEVPKKGKKKAADTPEQKEEWIYNKYNLHIFFDKELVDSKKYDPAFEINIDSSEFTAAVKEYDRAITYYQKAYDTAPDSSKSEILQAMTNLYTVTNKMDIAIANYEKLIQQDPKNKTFQFNLGLLYLSSKKHKPAIEHFKKVVEIDPNDVTVLYNLYAVYNNWAIKTKEENSSLEKEDTTYLAILKEGVPYIQKLTELKPENIEYIDISRNLAAIFQQKAELEKLYEKLKGLESKNSNNPSYWDTFAKICLNLNKSGDATKAFDKADQLRKTK
jgi:tetratricopeptide (TPR) repeat protein